VRAGAAAACHTANHRAAAISETHLDDDAVPSLERLLPGDFAVPVYFTCGERWLLRAALAAGGARDVWVGMAWGLRRRTPRAHWAG
jgi:hypothetical protein